MARSEEPIGKQLIKLGWRQGSLMPAVGRVHFELLEDGSWQTRTLPVKAGEQLIVASQDCDISASSEPFVEALPCYWAPSGTKEFDGCISGNSSRYFMIREEGAGKERRAYLVDATDRVQVLKRSLIQVKPGFPVSNEQVDEFYRRFRPWLGGRYSRIPLDPDVVRHVQRPIADVVKQLSEDHELNPSPVVREIRMAPIRGSSPFMIDLIVLVRDGVSTTDERVANLIGGLAETFQTSSDGTQLRKCIPYSAESLSVHDYEHTWKVALDHYSWEGQVEIGALPVHGLDHG